MTQFLFILAALAAIVVIAAILMCVTGGENCGAENHVWSYGRCVYCGALKSEVETKL